jgi:exopolysaccharide biosynthesis protein
MRKAMTAIIVFVFVSICAGLFNHSRTAMADIGVMTYYNDTSAPSISVHSEAVWTGERSVEAVVMRVPMSSYFPRIGLAKGTVGATESLADIAKRYNADAAVNGCFFSAYTDDPIKPPYHNIIAGGRVVHTGSTGTTLGFDASGDYRMERVKILVEGSQTGANVPEYPNWYAFLVNHPAESSNVAILYNSLYASETTPAKGTQVVIDENGNIVSISDGAKSIPQNGLVLLFAGSESYLAGRLRTGNRLTYGFTFENGDGAFWRNAVEAIGCGPRLVAAGQIAYDPVAEGFSSEKILVNSGARTAIGVKTSPERMLLLVCCKAATVREMASVMKELGAYDAMNLDGGASSGMWVSGSGYKITPGREQSNAVVIGK